MRKFAAADRTARTESLDCMILRMLRCREDVGVSTMMLGSPVWTFEEEDCWMEARKCLQPMATAGAVMKGLVWMRLVFWQRIFAKEGPAPNRTLVIDLFQ